LKALRPDPFPTRTFGVPLPGITYKPRPAAYALIFSREAAIATVEGKGGYFLPGGGSLPGEAPEETIQREVREELARDDESEAGHRVRPAG